MLIFESGLRRRGVFRLFRRVYDIGEHSGDVGEPEPDIFVFEWPLHNQLIPNQLINQFPINRHNLEILQVPFPKRRDSRDEDRNDQQVRCGDGKGCPEF